MVGTIGFAGGKAHEQHQVRRWALQLALPHLAASTLGGALTGVVAAFLGGVLLGPLESTTLPIITVSVLLLLAVADVLMVQASRVSRARQVPLSWKHTFPAPMSSVLYGFALGAGVFTSIYYWSFVSLLVAIVVSRSVTVGLIAGGMFGLARGLIPVVAGLGRDERVVDARAGHIERALYERPRLVRVASAFGTLTVAVSLVRGISGSM
jgi:apolipoprotein N-acyltransferase